jgi:hypothetical protein
MTSELLAVGPRHLPGGPAEADPHELYAPVVDAGYPRTPRWASPTRARPYSPGTPAPAAR